MLTIVYFVFVLSCMFKCPVLGMSSNGKNDGLRQSVMTQSGITINVSILIFGKK